MKRTRRVDIGVVVLAVLVTITIVIALWVGGGKLAISGVTAAGRVSRTVWLPFLLGMTLGGMIQVLIPVSLIQKWIGPTSGFKGLVVGSYLGLILTGGPWIRMPIIASIYKSGAGAGPVIALIAGTALVSTTLLVVWRLPFLGINIALAQYLASFLLPPIIGFVGAAAMRRLPGKEGALE